MATTVGSTNKATDENDVSSSCNVKKKTVRDVKLLVTF